MTPSPSRRERKSKKIMTIILNGKNKNKQIKKIQSFYPAKPSVQYERKKEKRAFIL